MVGVCFRVEGIIVDELAQRALAMADWPVTSPGSWSDVIDLGVESGIVDQCTYGALSSSSMSQPGSVLLNQDSYLVD